jgi:hypothetical protein
MKKKAPRRTAAGPLTSLSVRLSPRAWVSVSPVAPIRSTKARTALPPPGIASTSGHVRVRRAAPAVRSTTRPRGAAPDPPRSPAVRPILPSPRLVGPHARARIEAPKTEGGGALTPRDPAVRVRRGVGVGEIRPATSVRTSGGRLARPGRRIPEEDPGICGQARVLHHYYCGARWLCNVRLVLPPACLPAPVYSTSVNSVAGGPRFAGGRAPPDLPARVAAPPAILFKEIRRLHFGDILRDPLKKKKKKGVCCCAAGRGG